MRRAHNLPSNKVAQENLNGTLQDGPLIQATGFTKGSVGSVVINPCNFPPIENFSAVAMSQWSSSNSLARQEQVQLSRQIIICDNAPEGKILSRASYAWSWKRGASLEIIHFWAATESKWFPRKHLVHFCDDLLFSSSMDRLTLTLAAKRQQSVNKMSSKWGRMKFLVRTKGAPIEAIWAAAEATRKMTSFCKSGSGKITFV